MGIEKKKYLTKVYDNYIINCWDIFETNDPEGYNKVERNSFN